MPPTFLLASTNSRNWFSMRSPYALLAGDSSAAGAAAGGGGGGGGGGGPPEADPAAAPAAAPTAPATAAPAMLSCPLAVGERGPWPDDCWLTATSSRREVTADVSGCCL